MQSIQISWLFVLGSMSSYDGIVDSSYIMVYALKCVMTCESRKGPSWKLRLWDQFGFVVTNLGPSQTGGRKVGGPG